MDLCVGEDLRQLGGAVPLPVDPGGSPAPAQQRLQLRRPCSLLTWCFGAQQGPAHPRSHPPIFFQDLPKSGDPPLSVLPGSVEHYALTKLLTFHCPWPCTLTLGVEVAPVLGVPRRGHGRRVAQSCSDGRGYPPHWGTHTKACALGLQRQPSFLDHVPY